MIAVCEGLAGSIFLPGFFRECVRTIGFADNERELC